MMKVQRLPNDAIPDRVVWVSIAEEDLQEIRSQHAVMLDALEEIAEIAHKGANGGRTHGGPVATLRHIRDFARQNK